jgi:hypothetical protein
MSTMASVSHTNIAAIALYASYMYLVFYMSLGLNKVDFVDYNS